MNPYLIEACVNSVESAIMAEQGGANRVELCGNLLEGGTTPSIASIALTRKKINIGLNVMIRPRGGDFCYTDTEFEAMQYDIIMARNLGADGVVFGILNPDGSVNKERTSCLVELARPMEVTFHRAFDLTNDPFLALEEIISLGIERILTSGQKNKAQEGCLLIAGLINKAGHLIKIMPGSGVNEDNIAQIAKATGANEFHVSCRKMVESKMIFRRNNIFMGGLPSLAEYQNQITDAECIEKVKRILLSLNKI